MRKRLAPHKQTCNHNDADANEHNGEIESTVEHDWIRKKVHAEGKSESTKWVVETVNVKTRFKTWPELSTCCCCSNYVIVVVQYCTIKIVH